MEKCLYIPAHLPCLQDKANLRETTPFWDASNSIHVFITMCSCINAQLQISFMLVVEGTSSALSLTHIRTRAGVSRGCGYWRKVQEQQQCGSQHECRDRSRGAGGLILKPTPPTFLPTVRLSPLSLSTKSNLSHLPPSYHPPAAAAKTTA